MADIVPAAEHPLPLPAGVNHRDEEESSCACHPELREGEVVNISTQN